jgi:hypothetical protein
MKNMKYGIVVMFFLASNSFAHGGGKSCKSSLFDYQKEFGVTYEQISILKNADKILLSENGEAFYCESGDQIRDIHSSNFLCATKDTINIFDKQRVISKYLSTEHFSNGDGFEYVNIRHLAKCGFVAHKKQPRK